MQRAVNELGFRARDAIVIGDKHSDVEFGLRAGAKSILITGTVPDPAEQVPGCLYAVNLEKAAALILDPESEC
jgi:beta-phosphoglucomutase-like phosphatase (HAD superfamily)